jgi:hypothetical protein
MNITVERRMTQRVEIDPDLVSSGDMFWVMRLSAFDPIILLSGGSGAGGHCV